MENASPKRILILGGGFAGLTVALELEKKLAQDTSVEITHYGLPGLQERALTMKSLGDAMRLRNHLIAHLEEADSDCCKLKEPLLTFVVAGGGFAGVETVAGINDFVRGALRSYPHLTEDMLRVVLVHPGPVILPELNEKLGAYAQRKLAGRKVEVRLNTKVEGFSGRGSPIE